MRKIQKIILDVMHLNEEVTSTHRNAVLSEEVTSIYWVQDGSVIFVLPLFLFAVITRKDSGINAHQNVWSIVLM